MDDKPTWPSILFVAAGALLTGLGVILGAFGAHVFGQIMNAVELDTYRTGIQYQLIHGIALIVVGMLIRQLARPRPAIVAGWLFITGILLFCFPLYVLALRDAKFMGAVAPFGGSSFILGWGFVFYASQGGWKQTG